MHSTHNEFKIIKAFSVVCRPRKSDKIIEVDRTFRATECIKFNADGTYYNMDINQLVFKNLKYGLHFNIFTRMVRL